MIVTTKFVVTAVTMKLVVTAVMTKLVSTAVTTKLVVAANTTKNLAIGSHEAKKNILPWLTKPSTELDLGLWLSLENI